MSNESQLILTPEMIRKHYQSCLRRDAEMRRRGVNPKFKTIVIGQELAIALELIEAAACKQRDRPAEGMNNRLLVNSRVNMQDYHDAIKANSTDAERTEDESESS